MDKALLQFINTNKEFLDSKNERIQALDDITLSVTKQEFVSIIGPSGCGKTTLLRLAAGVDLPSSGQVLYDGKPVTGPSPERGLVFQAYSAFPWLTVRQNIAFGLDALPRASANRNIDEWLSRTGLTEFADIYPKALSGGMRQRMALARTMIVEPKLLLMDEPMGALDQLTREKMQLFVLQMIVEKQCTAVLVTHDIREAILLSDRVCILSARPGTLLHEIKSDLPKPRTHNLFSTSEFETIYDRVVEHLLE